MGGELPELEMVLDETLRKYPPAWVGPRRSVEPFEFDGHTIPAGAFVNYCSWASHHLPDVFPEPEAFRPERFAPEAKAALPKGAYVPFGGGSRTCIGMRFGQLEVRTIATLILSRFTLSLPDDFELAIRQMPTISPKRRSADDRRHAQRTARTAPRTPPCLARAPVASGSSAGGPRGSRTRQRRAVSRGYAGSRIDSRTRSPGRVRRVAPTPSHVHVRVGEQRQLQPAQQQARAVARRACRLRALPTASTDALHAEQPAAGAHLHLAALAAVSEPHFEPFRQRAA